MPLAQAAQRLDLRPMAYPTAPVDHAHRENREAAHEQRRCNRPSGQNGGVAEHPWHHGLSAEISAVQSDGCRPPGVPSGELRFYGEGETIIKPTDGPVEHFYIVKQGRVHGERPHSARRGTETTFEITSGECFPLAALIGERATRTEHLAAEDTFCLLLNKPAFIKLFSLSNPLRDFALRGVSSLLDQVNQQVQPGHATA